MHSTTTRIYDSNANTWSTGAEHLTASTEIPGSWDRHDAPYCYVMGGFNASTATTTNYRYDTTGNVWAMEAPFTTGRWAAGAAYFNGKIYLMGGGRDPPGKRPDATVCESTSSAAKWTGATPPIGLAWPEVVYASVGGTDYIYTAGGTTTTGDQNIVYRYNITARPG